MSYEIYAGNQSFHFTWNYNEKIIMPLMGGNGLRDLNGVSSGVAAEAIASLIEQLHKELRRMHMAQTINQGVMADSRKAIEEFMEKFGNGGYGHVLEAVFRLNEVMVACYRAPDEVFEIH